MFDDLVRSFSANAELVHEYAALRTGLRRVGDALPCQSVLVTSAQPQEGKTTVVLNLGLSAVLAGTRPVLVDADMRRPSLHRRLDLENGLGLSDILGGRAQVADVVQTVKTTATDPAPEGVLSVITAGRHGVQLAETLGGPTARAAVHDLTAAHELVVIDSPPVLAAADALLLAPLVDGVVIVLHTGGVTEEDVRRTRTRLEEAGGRVLGVVMNRFDPRVHGPSTHPYSAYYH